MNLLLRSELRAIVRQPLSTTFAVLCVGIAVASISLIHHLSVEIVERFGEFVIEGDFDYVIDLDSNQESEYFELIRRWQSGELRGITNIVPVLEGSLELNGQQVNMIGFDPIAAGNFSQAVYTDRTQFQANLLLQDAVIAAGLDMQTGETIGSAKIVSAIESNSPYLLSDIPTAQKLLRRPGEIDLVWLRSEEIAGTRWDSLVPGLLSASNVSSDLPELSGYQVQPFEWWNPSKSMGDAIVFNLAMLSFLTLLVAGFIIVQTLQTSIRNREQQFKVIETLGVSDLEKRGLVLKQCLAYGFVGCLLGVLVSVIGVIWVTDHTITSVWSILNGVGILKAIVLGLATTSLVGLMISFKSKPVSPVVRHTAGFLTLCVMVWCFQDISGLLGASLLSVCLCILHVLYIAPLVTVGVSKCLSVLPTKSLRIQMILRGSLEIQHQVRFAINALSIAVATAIGIGLMLASFRTEFTQLLSQRLSVDLHLANAASANAGQLQDIQGVDQVIAYRRGKAQINGLPFELIAANIDRDEASRYGYPSALQDGILISETAARRYDLVQGANVELSVQGQPVRIVAISHIFKDYGEPQARAVVPSVLIQPDLLIQDRYGIIANDVDAVKNTLSQQFPTVQVVDNQDVRELAIRVFNMSFASAQVMVNVAILVAVFGMASAMLALQVKRLRDMQVLTLLGSHRVTLIADALWQNTTIGFIAVMTALPLGIAIAWNLCYLVNPRAYGWSFDLDWSTQAWLVPSLLGILAAIFASLEPLRRVISRLVNEPLPTTQ